MKIGTTLRTAALVGASIIGLTTLVTGAFFTDSQSLSGNTVATGTVKIGFGTGTTALTVSGMAPGDVTTAPVTIVNQGTLQERYAVTSTSDATDANFLASQLVLVVKSGVTTCTSSGFSVDGTTLYTGIFGSTSGAAILGNTAQGQQTGDRILNAGAQESLCLQIRLPVSTGNTYQNKTTVASFAFVGEQTANNA